MKKKNLLIVGIILITIVFVGIKNYKSFAPTKVYTSEPIENIPKRKKTPDKYKIERTKKTNQNLLLIPHPFQIIH